MQSIKDGPSTTAFTPLALGGNATIPELKNLPISDEMRDALPDAPIGECVGWAIPFTIDSVVAVHDRPIQIPIGPSTAQWLVFLQTSDSRTSGTAFDTPDRFIRASTGRGHLAEHAADYVICYADGTEERIGIRRLHQVGGFYPAILDKCFEAVGAHKPYTREPSYRRASTQWGMSQWRIEQPDFFQPWTSWLWAWENPRPDTPIAAIRFEPKSGLLVVSAVSAGDAGGHPPRWRTRRKAILHPADDAGAGREVGSGLDNRFDDTFDDSGLLRDIRIDMGQIISARPRLIYDDEQWTSHGVDVIPAVSKGEVLIECPSHSDAHFHLADDSRIAVSDLEEEGRAGPLTAGAPADRPVQIRVVEREGDRPAPARLHLHGAAGEYLAPVDRHRIINPMWFEDPGTEAVLLDHSCAYTSGVATARVPLGEIFIEVTRGPEYCPLRQTFTFDEWMDAVRRGETFATFGPLVGLSVDGKPIGSQIDLPASGRSVELSWYVASATIPMSRVELVISGTVVRGEPEVILTHTSPIVITVDRLPLFSKPDATTILDQIEGSLIYLDSIAIRPDMATHARMVATLEGVRKKLKERIDRVPGG